MKAFPIFIENSPLLKTLTADESLQGKRGIPAEDQDKSLRLLSKEIRLSLGLTQEELADLADVHQDDVDYFEHSLPVQLETRQKILKTLYKSTKPHVVSMN